jgi:hypothetical protein
MSSNIKLSFFLLILLAGLFFSSPRVWASELILNGSFEQNGGLGSSTFPGWAVTTTDGNTGGNWYVQTGTSSPIINLGPLPAPPAGSFAAMTDYGLSQGGPAAMALTQSFTVSGPGSATLSLDYFILNPYSPYVVPDPATLGDLTQPNQQARVDILKGAAGSFDVSGSDILANVLQTPPGNPDDPSIDNAYQSLTMNIEFSGAGNYQLRFAAADTQGQIFFGVDHVSLDFTPAAAVVPEAESYVLFSSGIALVMFAVRLKVRTVNGPIRQD